VLARLAGHWRLAVRSGPAPGARGLARAAAMARAEGAAASGPTTTGRVRGPPRLPRPPGALRQGEVTTGAVKLGGIGVTGIVSAAL
jgi:hypothetical protein